MASRKLRALNAKEEKDAEMDMSPMIDMVFLLLIFFIVVSSPMIVKLDPKVKPPVAFNSTKPDSKNGRIVLNIRGEKDYYKVDYNGDDAKMETEEEIVAYIEEEVERLNALNSDYKPKLHLRGDKEALFKYSQKAVDAAGQAGVIDIVFSVYPFVAK